MATETRVVVDNLQPSGDHEAMNTHEDFTRIHDDLTEAFKEEDFAKVRSGLGELTAFVMNELPADERDDFAQTVNSRKILGLQSVAALILRTHWELQEED